MSEPERYDRGVMPPSEFPPLILDIEASGFGPTSYPVEIGLALSSGDKFCSLIRPLPDWTHWDAHAERMHGVSREVLAVHGKPVLKVAGQLNRLLRDRTVYSDGWVVDQPWLNRLFEAAALPCLFSLSSLELILIEPQMAIWHATKDALLRELGAIRHRASIDAYVVQETYRRTWEATTVRTSASDAGR